MDVQCQLHGDMVCVAAQGPAWGLMLCCCIELFFFSTEGLALGQLLYHLSHAPRPLAF
jgi:hypothetical protein